MIQKIVRIEFVVEQHPFPPNIRKPRSQVTRIQVRFAIGLFIVDQRIISSEKFYF